MWRLKIFWTREGRALGEGDDLYAEEVGKADVCVYRERSRLWFIPLMNRNHMPTPLLICLLYDTFMLNATSSSSLGQQYAIYISLILSASNAL